MAIASVRLSSCAPDVCQLAGDSVALLRMLIGRRLEQLAHARDDVLNDVRRQDVLPDGVEDRMIERLHRHPQTVQADAAPLVVMRRAAVDEHPATSSGAAVVRAADEQAAVAAAAPREAGEQVLRLDARPPPSEALRGVPIDGASLGDARMRSLPGLVGDDPQRRRRNSYPVIGRPIGDPLLAPAVPLARAVPDDLAAIQVAEEDLGLQDR